MAKLIPDLDLIKTLHQPPTEGELTILEKLKVLLPDSFEIYFQPLINGDNPDIVILKKEGGIIIIEVKDWNLKNYYLDDRANWHLQENDVAIKSPLSQVKTYKDNFIDLHIENLLDYKTKNKYYNALINCVVYFHNVTESQIYNFLRDDFEPESNKAYFTFLKFINILGKDSLNKKNIDQLIERTGLSRTSKLFDDDLYTKFKRYLQPPYHRIEEGIEITYSKEQIELIRSDNVKRKIKGIAGCGKTMVLAKRAVNAHKRTDDHILILTFNLSLKNYIHDKINEVRENFYWNNFYITNYHQFFKAQANNHNLEIKSLAPFSDVNFFERVKRQIKPYKAIFIDEVQDYQTSWLEIITKFFANENTEFVVFGDEKQNIYNRPLDDTKNPIIKTVPGNWNKTLNTSRRFTSNIGRLALKFQKTFFTTKYSIDELQIIANPQIDFLQQTIQYHFFPNYLPPSEFIKKYSPIVQKLNVHPSDIGILSARVDYIRGLDKLIRNNLKEKTETTFETEEIFQELKSGSENLIDTIEKIRRNKKFHFWFKTGTTKLSTVHSFKGWEVHTLFYIIEEDSSETDDFTTEEIVYTGLTRARINLFVINIGNLKYHDFFRNNIENNYVA